MPNRRVTLFKGSTGGVIDRATYDHNTLVPGQRVENPISYDMQCRPGSSVRFWLVFYQAGDLDPGTFDEGDITDPAFQGEAHLYIGGNVSNVEPKVGCQWERGRAFRYVTLLFVEADAISNDCIVTLREQVATQQPDLYADITPP